MSPTPAKTSASTFDSIDSEESASSYDPREYWQSRLENAFNLRGVGNINLNERSNRWLYRRKGHVIGRIFEREPLDGKDVLDIGCGVGFFVDWYLQRGARVFGMDITDVSVAHLTEQFPEARFRVQDITARDYRPPRQFDIVNIWDVAYHIVDDTKFAAAINNMLASLKPGGLLITTDWLAAPASHQIAPHVRARNLGAYEALLKPRGAKLAQHWPLYHLLNQPHYWRTDRYMGWLYYLLDQTRVKPSADNLSVAVWRL